MLQQTVGRDPETRSDLAPLFQEFAKTRDINVRNLLVEHHLYVIDAIARHMAAHLPLYIEHNDLFGYGCVGMIQAVERFDLSRGLEFATYCGPRVRGAMLDGLRLEERCSRQLLELESKIDWAKRKIENETERSAQDHETADALGLSEAEFNRQRWHILATRHVSLNSISKHFADFETKTLEDELEESLAHVTKAPDQIAEQAECYKELTLPLRKEQKRILSQYLDGHTLKEVGRELGVTESRVSQLMKQALGAIRERVIWQIRHNLFFVHFADDNQVRNPDTLPPPLKALRALRNLIRSN